MALVWSGPMGCRRAEVRSAGASLRLYVDGVLHTAWNPRTGLTGAVWDPLAFAALLAARPVRTVLLLGVGGGAAVHLLRRHVRPARIVAVEREAVLLDVARRHFGLAGPDVELVEADAVAWVAAARRPAFDLVIDDLFHEEDGEPVRAAGGTSWWRRLARRTSRGGVLVVNFAERSRFESSALARDPWFRRRFPTAVRFSCPGYTNAIVAFTDAPGGAALLRRRLADLPTVAGAARRLLRFRVRDV
jgi:spermidine synthase